MRRGHEIFSAAYSDPSDLHLDHVKEQTTYANHQMHARNTWTSPFVKIPPEILSKIFSHCSETPTTICLPMIPGSYPWWLGQVCSGWREVLWSSPTTWNIDVSKPKTKDPKIYLQETIHEILSRTKGLISLRVDSYNSTHVSDLILSSSVRFVGLYLHTLPHSWFRTLLELPIGALHSLKCLDVSLDWRRGPVHENFIGVHQGLPNLRELGIGGDTPIDLYLPYLPLSQLTSLSIKCVSVSTVELHLILRHCTSLLEADIWITSIDHLDNQPEGTILSTLKSFSVTVYAYMDWNSLLSPLTLPSLQTLHCVGCPSPTFPQALTALFSRSKCSLLSLNIYPNADSSEDGPQNSDLVLLLQETPKLTTLAIRYLVSPPLIHAVHGGLLPRLQEGNWTLKPGGLNSLFDLLDIDLSQKFSGTLRITCLGGEGFSAVQHRYCRNYRAYETAGVNIVVTNLIGYDLRDGEGQPS
ncbi:hypothetical protein BDZ94DRAFT_1322756 [Collybia nuda]|uniref:F-box domain-containing protein n=1 Tax=Collybia nuda TaxID=64659 RepID=A0A9P5Y4Q5_9AGAR|nr:hypothetical protein BDZ94DRAFT_1322756 [Collybia nuda]